MIRTFKSRMVFVGYVPCPKCGKNGSLNQYWMTETTNPDHDYPTIFRGYRVTHKPYDSCLYKAVRESGKFHDESLKEALSTKYCSITKDLALATGLPWLSVNKVCVVCNVPIPSSQKLYCSEHKNYSQRKEPVKLRNKANYSLHKEELKIAREAKKLVSISGVLSPLPSMVFCF
jgi:hypothetical protein